MRSLSPEYDQIKQLRSSGDAARAMSILRARRPTSDHDAFEAVVCLFVCGEVDNALHVCETHPWKKKWAVQITQALLLGFRSSDVEGALARARDGASAPAAPCDAAAIYLLLLKKADRIEEADAYIHRHFQNFPAGESFLLAIMAEVALAAGKWREAYQAACGVLASDPYDYRTLLVLGAVNFQVGNIHEALGNAVRANATRKGSAPAVLQLMRCRNKLGNYYTALASFDALEDATNISPDLCIEAGKAYEGLARSRTAIAHYAAALELDPNSIEALRSLVAIYALEGHLDELETLVARYRDVIHDDTSCLYWLGLAAANRGAVDEAAWLLERARALAASNGELLRKLPWPVPQVRLRHDLEQLDLLEQRGRLDAKGREALAFLRQHATHTDAYRDPEGLQAQEFKRALCTVSHTYEPPFSGPVLAANDYAAFEERYLSDRLVVIDNFLSEEALQSLRTFCEEATIWRLNYERGYVGAVLAEGLSSRLLLTVCYELKKAMPRVLGEHPLTQAWAFKYDQRLEGVDMHADAAAVNVNFWITPDDACQDPTRGGMVIYNIPVPASWTFYEYNNESEKLAVYLKLHDASAQRVGYKANRCVLFDSSLVHVTDDLDFKPGYCNRRVNITLLYGKPRNVT